MHRRSFLRLALAGAAGAALSACGETEPSEAEPTVTPGGAEVARRSVLLAYFSRAGENYHYGGRRNLTVGNTEMLARMIRTRMKCDVHRIEAAKPYSRDYDETVARNVREQVADARPRIADPLASIERYDTILLASPIWNVRAPMIMATFAERYDFSGKIVFPVVTYAVSGLGTVPDDYERLCDGARIGQGLAVRGERSGQPARSSTRGCAGRVCATSVRPPAGDPSPDRPSRVRVFAKWCRSGDVNGDVNVWWMRSAVGGLCDGRGGGVVGERRLSGEPGAGGVPRFNGLDRSSYEAASGRRRRLGPDAATSARTRRPRSVLPVRR